MGRALAAVVVRDLAGAPAVHAETAESVNVTYSMQASRVVEGYFYESHGRLELRATVRDEGRSATLATAGGGVGLANELAKKLSPAARAVQTTNEALRAYGEALSTRDRSGALRAFESATKYDPRFLVAYLDWAKVLWTTGDREGALRVIEAAQREEPDAIERAELDYAAASIRGDANARKKALESLTRLTPSDPKVFRELAQLELSERRFQVAVRNYEAAARLNPNEAEMWNELGYALAFAQDLPEARRSLERYQDLLPPGNANGLDSLGEVSFYLGDFAGAAKHFLEADQKNRAEFGGEDLLKAAEARVLAGQLRDGDELLRKYVGLFSGGPKGRSAYQVAQWEFLTGRRRSAMAGLEKIIPELDADGQAIGLSQLSIWKLQTGDRKAAVDLANQAAAHAVSPAARNLSALCRGIATEPGTASVPGGASNSVADAYALLCARKYAEAAPLLEKLYRASNPNGDGQIRTLLAWAYVETNRSADAGRLLQTYPLPLSSGEPVLASLIFPRYLFLRGMVLQQEGKRAEAKSAYELYLKYAGDVPDIFGDEVTARRNVGGL